MKYLELPPIALALALLAGCASYDSAQAGRTSLVTIRAKVDAYDPDGLLFDLVTSTREFDPGTATRGPLARVVVTAPGDLAGRKYLIALPEVAAAGAGRTDAVLRNRGAAVVFELPRKLVVRGQREIIEFADLRWPR